MKRLTIVLLAAAALALTIGNAQAALEVIGTATYQGSDYNLIYEDDSVYGGLVWLDFTRGGDSWQDQVNWAAGLGANLTVNLNPGVSANVDWGTGWRLPSAGSNPQTGYNRTTSEMGHLYYESLEQTAQADLASIDLSPFANLSKWAYWSGTGAASFTAWNFSFAGGYQNKSAQSNSWYGAGVRPADVSTVPVPGAVLLLGSGLIGLFGIRRVRGKR